MKKILVLFLAVISIFPMTSCGTSEQSAYDMYVDANEAYLNADSMRTNVLMDITMESGGVSSTLTVTGAIDKVARSKTDVDMKVDMTMDIAGNALSSMMYYKEGVAYMDLMGMKMKASMTIEEAVQQASANPIVFPEEAVKEQSVNDVTDGKEIAFTLEGEALSELMDKQLSGLESAIGVTGELTYGDVVMKALVDNGSLKSISLYCPFDISTAAEAISGNVDMKMDILQIGGVTIDFPTDLDTYE